MTALFRIGVASALSVCIAGSVTPRTSTVPTAMVTPLRTKVIPADSVRDAIAIGKSTKADVIAALGETLHRHRARRQGDDSPRVKKIGLSSLQSKASLIQVGPALRTTISMPKLTL